MKCYNFLIHIVITFKYYNYFQFIIHVSTIKQTNLKFIFTETKNNKIIHAAISRFVNRYLQGLIFHLLNFDTLFVINMEDNKNYIYIYILFQIIIYKTKNGITNRLVI